MIVKRLGDLTVPAIGQGAGGNDICEDAHRVRVLQYGIELGMTLVDTAEAYRDGRSEEIVGKAIRGNRANVFLATKFSPEHNHYQGVVAALEGSLRRLKTDHVDLYQLHWTNPSIPIEETMRALTDLQASGKVRHVGLSNCPRRTILKAQQVCNGRIDAAQMEYNLLERGVEEDLLAYSEDNELLVLAYQPLLRPSKGGEVLEAIAWAHECTAAQVTLAWLASHRTVVPIPKTLNLTHVRENALAAELTLTREEIAAIERAFHRKILEVPPEKIRVLPSDQEPVYGTMEEAVENRFGLAPSPQELAQDIQENGILKPVQLRPSTHPSGTYDYDLTQGRVRYWAWIMAYGRDVPIPAYVSE